MNWDRHWAKRTEAMKRSAVRELLRLCSRPEIISLAGGLPAEDLFPIDDIARATQHVLSSDAARASLQYGPTEGVDELRDWIAAKHSSRTLPLSREHVVITTGSQQALDLLGRILLEPGDEVAVDGPTYLAALSAWRPLGVRFQGLDGSKGTSGTGNSESRVVDDRTPPNCRPSGDRSSSPAGDQAIPKLRYVIPNFANPTGATLGLALRRTLLENAQQRDCVVLEDDPYGELRYSGEALPSLLELEGARNGGIEASRVIHVGSFSKVLAPGFRVGYVIAGSAVVDRLVRAKQAADLHTSSFTQQVILRLLREGVLERHRPSLLSTYKTRRDTMLAALERHMPTAANWTRPEGGMFVWVTLEPDVDTAALLSRALERGVAFVPGAEFHGGTGGRNTLRLNFTHATPDRIELGIRRLGEVLR